MPLTHEQFKQIQLEMAAYRDPRAVAKLNVEQRHQALALVKAGYPHGIVAQLFGITRATIGHMVSKTSRHYRDIRAEYDNQGHDDYLRRYLDQNLIEQANGLKVKIKREPESVEAKAYKRNPKADKRAGEHTYRGITFKVLWHDRGVERTTGWIWVKPDDYDHPLPYGYDIVFGTSAQCYQEACKLIDADDCL